MSAKKIEVQRNLNDGEIYEKRFVDNGGFVCAKCYHAYVGRCGNCGEESPDDVDMHNQWSEVYLFDCGSGELIRSQQT